MDRPVQACSLQVRGLEPPAPLLANYTDVRRLIMLDDGLK
jgi:hypothetical protein